MPPDQPSRELADLEALIAAAESELAALRGRPDRLTADPHDPVGCLELWLAALRRRCAELRPDDTG